MELNENRDSDSGIDAPRSESDVTSFDSSSSTGMRSYIWKEENCRMYNSHYLTSGEYPFPVDENEEELQHFCHMIIRRANQGRLHLAPIKENPRSCLDVGTGMGYWVIDFAEKFPTTKCYGIDFILVQPMLIPPNVEFIIDDANLEWVSRQHDLIYARDLRGSVVEKHLVQESYKCLQPGGFFERTEILPWDIQFHSDTRPGIVLEWCAFMRWVMRNRDQDIYDLETYKRTMQEAGFINVEIKTAMIPFGSWANDILDEQSSKLYTDVVLDSLDGLSMALFTREFQWSPALVSAWLAEVKIGLNSPSVLPYMTMRVIYGQKPA